MLTTLYFFFGRGTKDTMLFSFMLDLVIMVFLVFTLGRALVWADVAILAVLILCLNIPIRRYEKWREKERLRLMHTIPDWPGGFPQKWVPYADFWSQLIGRQMSVVYAALLFVGKCSTFIL